MELTLEQKILYSNTYCAYRDFKPTGVKCKNKYSYGVCDLDLCPIVQQHFANILFQQDGIYLFVKKPSEESIAGTWEKIKLEIDIDEPEKTLELIRNHTLEIPEKNKQALEERFWNIVNRYKFLKEKGKPILAIEREISLLEEIETEEEEEVGEEEGGEIDLLAEIEEEEKEETGEETE